MQCLYYWRVVEILYIDNYIEVINMSLEIEGWPLCHIEVNDGIAVIALLYYAYSDCFPFQVQCTYWCAICYDKMYINIYD